MKYKIGQKIKYSSEYPMACSERFPHIFDDTLTTAERASEPIPISLCLFGEAFVIGLKRAIMGKYKYTPGYNNTSGFDDSYPEHIPAYATGKFEECLVCTKQLKPFKPFLVRKQDIVI